MSISKSKSTSLKHFNDSKAFIENSSNIDDIYKKIDEYNPNEKRKIFIVFDEVIADMLSNKNLNPVVSELFSRAGKLNISLDFITQSYSAVPKNIRLNSTHYFIMKIPSSQSQITGQAKFTYSPFGKTLEKQTS